MSTAVITDLIVTERSGTLYKVTKGQWDGGTGGAAGSQLFTSSSSWTCPAGVSSVYVVCIGGGGGGMNYSCCQYAMQGGGGGGLGWKTNFSVTAGVTYSVVVGAAGASGAYSSGSTAGGDSYFISAATCKGGGGSPGRFNQTIAGGSFVGDGGGNGGGCTYTGVTDGPSGGGGAGGYSGAGGSGIQALNS